MEQYLVGGAVRDQLLGRPSRDKDHVILGASEAEFRARFPQAVRVGQRADAVFVMDGEEYSLSPASDIQADLSGRDLTINALARDSAGQLLAHPQALADLEAKILRPVAAANFLADPLRVFRAARFAAQFPDFSVAPELLELMASVAGENLLAGLPAERVGVEIRRACAAPRPSRFLHLLAETGSLTPWLAELAQAATIPAGPAPFHHGSLLDHLGQVMDRVAVAAPAPELAVWMALVHDLGKTATPPEQWPKHHDHDTLGVAMAEALGLRLRLPTRHVRAGKLAARRHMTLARYGELRPGTRVDVLLELHNARLVEEMALLVLADHQPDSHRARPGLEATLPERLRGDLAVVMAVELPLAHRDQGPASAQRLRELRSLALKQAGSGHEKTRQRRSAGG